MMVVVAVVVAIDVVDHVAVTAVVVVDNVAVDDIGVAV